MLWLPPVSWRPNFTSAGAVFTWMDDQSASSSSARIIASAVRTPCPISVREAVTVTWPVSSICRYMFGSNQALASGTAVAVGCEVGSIVGSEVASLVGSAVGDGMAVEGDAGAGSLLQPGR